MKKVKIAIIGAGNISNTRHIPALKKLKNVEIFGVIGVRKKNIERTIRNHKIKNSLLIEDGKFFEGMNGCPWFQEVDAVVVGAPPKEHYPMVDASLRNDKHVLVEKPMTMDEAEADKLIELARKKKKTLCVMHNFQFTNGIKRLERLIGLGELGSIISFDEFQLTNKYRRLPEWYNDLPLGLFYDEAPHFMYLLDRFGGKLKVDFAHAYYGKKNTDNTPTLLNVSLTAGVYPANIFLNFEAPVCEWYFIVCGSKKIAFYDLFKDILVVVPSDNEHLASDILKNNVRMTSQYWYGFVNNGIKMVTGNLLYGHDVVMKKFVDSIISGNHVDDSINGESGKKTIQYIHEIVKKLETKKVKG